MKKEFTFDKYGYRLKSVKSSNFNYNRYFIDTTFISNEGYEETLTIKHYSKSLFQTLIATKKVKKELKGKNIIECLAYLIIEKYEFAAFFSYNFYQLVDCLPISLIMNDEAIKELLSLIPEHSKDLYIELGRYIKTRREDIIRRKELIAADNKILDEKKSKVQKDLGL